MNLGLLFLVLEGCQWRSVLFVVDVLNHFVKSKHSRHIMLFCLFTLYIPFFKLLAIHLTPKVKCFYYVVERVTTMVYAV